MYQIVLKCFSSSIRSKTILLGLITLHSSLSKKKKGLCSFICLGSRYDILSLVSSLLKDS